jgi:uncharacterized membrane protein YeaQ/YmgE (transglycosylase-associated protein family)
MDVQGLIIWLVIGAIIGGWLLGSMGIFAAGTLGTILTAVIGAVVLLFIVGLVKRA